MCLTPYLVKNSKMEAPGYKPVPCGRCVECYKRRVSGWSFRLMQQEKISDSAHFITLTYDTRNVPITRKAYMGLEKRDLQLFFKRLRKAHNKATSRPLRYYAVGEYGTRSMRPHYHIILFNAQLELIQDAWGLGQVHYGSVTGASIGYTLKYMCKDKVIPLHGNDDRLPEFAVMSKGLGVNYLTDSSIFWHKNDLVNRMYLPIDDGKKIAMPRYYKGKLYTEIERKSIAYVAARRSRELRDKYELQMFRRYGFSWPKIQVDIDVNKIQMFKNASTRSRDKI